VGEQGSLVKRPKKNKGMRVSIKKLPKCRIIGCSVGGGQENQLENTSPQNCDVLKNIKEEKTGKK